MSVKHHDTQSPKLAARYRTQGGYEARHTWFLAAGWTAVVAGLLIWNLSGQQERSVQIARAYARAAYEKDLGAERITTEAAMAKAFATEAAQRIVDDAVQILGGRGVMADHPVDLLYRSVRALRIYEGASEVQQTIIARQELARM